MSLILATGSNLGNKKENLNLARLELSKKFSLTSISRIYCSEAVDYFDQPDFYNQVLEFKIPNYSPQDVLRIIQEIEKSLGRKKYIPKGPRLIDIDILFWNLEKIKTSNLIIPHPSWDQRSFVVLPLQELPFHDILLRSNLKMPHEFCKPAKPIL